MTTRRHRAARRSNGTVGAWKVPAVTWPDRLRGCRRGQPAVAPASEVSARPGRYPMTATTSSPSTAIAVPEPVFTQQEQLALAGFLAGYTGLTREAYALDLRQYASWCQQHHLRLFQARRADIECFARDMEAKGRARATVTRRLCTMGAADRLAGPANRTRDRRALRAAARDEAPTRPPIAERGQHSGCSRAKSRRSARQGCAPAMGPPLRRTG